MRSTMATGGHTMATGGHTQLQGRRLEHRLDCVPWRTVAAPSPSNPPPPFAITLHYSYITCYNWLHQLVGFTLAQRVTLLANGRRVPGPVLSRQTTNVDVLLHCWTDNQPVCNTTVPSAYQPILVQYELHTSSSGYHLKRAHEVPHVGGESNRRCAGPDVRSRCKESAQEVPVRSGTGI